MSYMDSLTELAGFARDIKVAESTAKAVESQSDLTATNRENVNGPAEPVNNYRVNVMGVEMDSRVLAATGLLLAGFAVVKLAG